MGDQLGGPPPLVVSGKSRIEGVEVEAVVVHPADAADGDDLGLSQSLVVTPVGPPEDDGEGEGEGAYAGFLHPSMGLDDDMGMGGDDDDVQWEDLGAHAATTDRRESWDYGSTEDVDMGDGDGHDGGAADGEDVQQENRELPVMDDLQWGHPVKIIGSMMTGPLQLHLCPECDEVINRYGRLVSCKHTFCAACAVKVQNRETPCTLCTAFRFANPPGSLTKARPIVDYFGLDQDMYMCDAVISGRADKPCGRGFLSEANRESCSHDVRAFRTRIDSANTRRDRPLSTGRQHQELPPRRQQPYHPEQSASRHPDDYRDFRRPHSSLPYRGAATRESSAAAAAPHGSRYADHHRDAAYPPTVPTYRDDGYGFQTQRYREHEHDEWNPAPLAAPQYRPHEREAMPWDAHDPSATRHGTSSSAGPTREVRYYY
eukprot:m.29432 g.29432  ORF g.29432 m.29432 type:complete len:429 (-) comp12113_c0_seq1:24-1310(-)